MVVVMVMVVVVAVMVVVLLVIEMAKAVSFALLFVYLGDGTSEARFGDGQGGGHLISQGFGDCGDVGTGRPQNDIAGRQRTRHLWRSIGLSLA